MNGTIDLTDVDTVTMSELNRLDWHPCEIPYHDEFPAYHEGDAYYIIKISHFCFDQIMYACRPWVDIYCADVHGHRVRCMNCMETFFVSDILTVIGLVGDK